MSQQFLASKVVITEEEPQIRQIAGVSTSRLGVVGITEKGPFGGVLITSPAEYRRVFGGYVGAGEVAQAVDGFFLGGGKQCVVSRVVHFTDPADATTASSTTGTRSLSNGAAAPTLRIDAKYEGAYSLALVPKVAAATSGEAARFNLLVLKNGVVIETWANLTMDPADDRYAETIINDPGVGSAYIAVEDLLAASGTVLGDRPANGTFAALAGGTDGLVGLVDADFIGASGETRTGLRVFDTDDLAVNLLIVPGRATSAVHNALIAYCEVTRNKACFPILDPPAGLSATEMITYVEATAALLNLSEFGAIYWPRVEVVNPSKAVFGNTERIFVAPSGYVAGTYARNDAAREGGVYDAPAGQEKGVLFGVLGFETDECLDGDKLDLVYPKRINPLTTRRGQPRYIDGSRTLKGNGNFPSVSERRGVIFIEQSVKEGLQFARHRNNDATLRAECERTVVSFLDMQRVNRAFRSLDPAKAYFVDFGEGLNTPAIQFANKLLGRVGLATQKPAEFIGVAFSQDTRAFTEAESA